MNKIYNKINNKVNNFKSLSLSQTTLSILLGSLLGNGSLKNAQLSIKQSIKQESYLKYKADILTEISNSFSIIPSGQNYLYQSTSLPILTDIHHLTYNKNTLNIKRKWLNVLTPLSLCIWWLDNGCIISKGRQGVLCTDKFSLISVHKLVRYLQVVWKLETKVLEVKKVYKGKERIYYRILLNKDNLEKLLRIILPFFPVEEVLYKGIVGYNNIDLQQRWISEMKELVLLNLKEKIDQKVQRMI